MPASRVKNLAHLCSFLLPPHRSLAQSFTRSHIRFFPSFPPIYIRVTPSPHSFNLRPLDSVLETLGYAPNRSLLKLHRHHPSKTEHEPIAEQGPAYPAGFPCSAYPASYRSPGWELLTLIVDCICCPWLDVGCQPIPGFTSRHWLAFRSYHRNMPMGMGIWQLG